MTPFTVIIPARMASTRLPRKPLLEIAGKPMIIRVAEQAAKSQATRVIVATDHEEIVTVCQGQGIEAILTRTEHHSGTDRLAEVAALLSLDQQELVINVQGDEPLLDPSLIDQLASVLALSQAEVATAAHPIESAADFTNPNVVKVVLNAKGEALYFSRAPIPWNRDHFAQGIQDLPPDQIALRHIGIYGYRAGFLHQYAALTPSPLERIESLEQLRVLWHGYAIAVAKVDQAPLAGVDTQADLERVRAHFEQQS